MSAARTNCTSTLKEISGQPRRLIPHFAVFNLDKLREALTNRGMAVADDDNLPGERRFYPEDPWGNRLEFIEVQK